MELKLVKESLLRAALFHCRCSSAEQKTNFPDGILKKEVKTHEQKEKDLEQVGVVSKEALL